MNRGFTLIEMAITLIIIGLLLGLGVTLIGPLVKRAKYTETKETLNANVESIIGYASINNCIPDTSNWKNIVRSPKDSWGKDFLYKPASEISSSCSYNAGICQMSSTSLKIRQCEDSNCNTYNEITNIAFVMISGGTNYNIQTNDQVSTIKVYEPGTSNIDDYSGDFVRPEEYDDLVKWVTLFELKTKIGCGTNITTPSKPTILTKELPVGHVGSSYQAEIYAEGGIPYSGNEYDWCWSGNLPNGMQVKNQNNQNIKNCSQGWSKGVYIVLNKNHLNNNDTGTYYISFSVKDSQGNSTTKSYVLTITD